MNAPTLRVRLARFDAAVDRAIEPLRGHRRLDVGFYTLTALADHSVLWMLIAATQALSHRRRRRALGAIVALGAESLLVNGVIKGLIGRRRPIDPDHPHPLGLRYPRTSSFPSGHASAAAAAVWLLGARPRERVLLAPVAALVAVSRVYVRIHHASDVVGGAVVGTLYGLFAQRLLRWIER
jgi:undecaprenyl-diphosphatase